jgi:hypothetical protein
VKRQFLCRKRSAKRLSLDVDTRDIHVTGTWNERGSAAAAERLALWKGTPVVGNLNKLFGSFLLLTLDPVGLSAKPADTAIFFETKIRPLLSAHCLSCHGIHLQMGGLNLADEASFLKGSQKGPVVAKGDPENSRLIQAVRNLGHVKMPPTGMLTAQQISDLTEWVQQGAPWSNTQSLGSAGRGKDEKTSQSPSDFWSFQPVKAQSLHLP